MGQSQGKEAKLASKTVFQPDEIEQLYDNFIKLLGKNKQEKINLQQKEQLLQNQQITAEIFQKLFSNDKIFAKKIYNWFVSISEKGIVTIKNIIDGCEYLFGNCQQYRYQEFNNLRLESIELMIVLSIETNWKQFQNIQDISKYQINALLNHIFRIFGEQDEKLNKSLIKDVFDDNESDKIKLKKFQVNILNKLSYINRVIKEYFKQKFFNGITYYKIPKMDKKSSIMSDATVAFFYLGGLGMRNCDAFYQLYNSNESGTSFNRIANAILGFNGPTLFLIKHVEKNEDGSHETHVFGACNQDEWQEQLQYQGDASNFLFQLRPQQKYFYTYSGEGGHNFSYFNQRFIENSKYKVGLGFGGDDGIKNFRLWIDDEVETKSHTKPQDKAYAIGYLLDPNIYQLKITNLEVYGIGSQYNLDNQEQYRIRRMEEIQKARKVDKKMMFSGQVGAMFIPGLMKHRDELREDVKRRSSSDEEYS
ncbi:hypothetical protein PPERSA_11366 [Pseudocohnilembus persalinus]|uniref:Oxidation resistance protein 1 n=1 Tax=Pseudocohnilembus persalinus TaxID=266149 RepID=A0A0V0QPR6_PSEPJ|nr:hypothetical protein PPERSA_11366 [Pseudocohnilembus persalinus]|eukprot:KRX04242.1 hypothetical protein PPERSA_11366 [Pseudocohnilembus persalinus]